MKKLLTLSVIGTSLILGSNPAKADWDYWGYKVETETINGHNDSYTNLYTINSATGVGTLRQRFCYDSSTVRAQECYANTGLPILQSRTDLVYPEKHINKDTLIIRQKETNQSSDTIQKKYNLNGNTLTSETITTSTTYWYDDYSYVQVRGAAKIDSDGNYYSDVGGQMWIKQTSDGTISFGKSGSDTAIYSLSENGVSQGGSNLISRTSDGITSIGANSLKLQESSGFQKMWATNESGKSIPIDITNGSKLLINGRDVEQSINNVGALSAALTGLPTVPTETTLACGLGTGTHGGDFAFSGGCASKVNEKLSINYAASMTMPGQDYAGDFEDTFSARAGFVWKLGKATKPTQISMKETKELKEEIADLKENNKNIIAQNNALLARFERLEKVALGDLKTKDLAVYQLK